MLHLAQSHGIFYMHQVPIVITVPNINKIINPFFSETSQQTHKIEANIAIITEFWHRAKYYFTCISNTWYLINVSNMNKSTHSSQRYHNKYTKWL